MTKSYQVNEVKEYSQTPGKIYCLNPAFERHLPGGKNHTVLDVGCGDGYYYSICKEKGYKYTGVDLSDYMVAKAETNYPDGNFKKGSCLDLSKIFDQNSFDVVIASMLFPEFETLEIMKKALCEINFVLKDQGVFLLGTSHPAFDMYMRKYLLNANNVVANFYSYFDSGKDFIVKSKTMNVTFYDHHWTLEDYVNKLLCTGFEIDLIDECKVVEKAKEKDQLYESKITLPSYILFKAKKKHNSKLTN